MNSRKICRTETSDAMNLEFADDYYDFVFSYHALEHIESSKALREIHRVEKRAEDFDRNAEQSRIVGYIAAKALRFQTK